MEANHERMCSSGVFENPQVGNAFLDYHRTLRESGKYIDLEIETSGGQIIRAHRWVLEARFPAFRRLFSDSLTRQRINLTRYSTDVVEAIIDYAYSTQLRVTESTALKILLLAHSLNCMEVISWCRSFICPRISPANVREVWKTANLCADEGLLRACVPAITTLFADTPIESSLLEVTGELGLRYLSGLYQVNSALRSESQAFSGNEAFWAVSTTSEGARAVTRVKLHPPRYGMKMEVENRIGSCYAGLEGKIYIAGGKIEDETVNTFESIDPTSGQRISLPSMSVPRVSSACVVTDKFLYILGGWNSSEGDLSSCERFSWSEGRWEGMPTMLVKRQWPAALRIPESGLLAIGGWSDYLELNDVEFLDLNGETEDFTSWRKLPSMLRGRGSPSACFCRNSVFVCTKNAGVLDLERLDLRAGQWTRITSRFAFTEDSHHFLLPLNASLWVIEWHGGMYEVEMAENAGGEITDCRVTKRHQLEGFSRGNYISNCFLLK